MHALDDQIRWDVLALLARGKPLSVSEIAAGIRRNLPVVSKHLRVLRDARAVTVQPDANNDARRQLYAVPAAFLTNPGTIDYGFCLLRFA